MLMLLPWIELLLCIACKIELWDAQESMGFMVSIRDPVAPKPFGFGFRVQGLGFRV